jgi:hypothetical protein
MDVHATIREYITQLHQKATAPLTRDSFVGMQEPVEHLGAILDQANQLLSARAYPFDDRATPTNAFCRCV